VNVFLLQRHKSSFPVFHKYLPYEKMFQIKFVLLYEIYVLYHVNFHLYISMIIYHFHSLNYQKMVFKIHVSRFIDLSLYCYLMVVFIKSLRILFSPILSTS
jgi:hypothetical protein